MRDPSLVASKADIRQQAIKGGEVPQADIGRVRKLEESDLVGRPAEYPRHGCSCRGSSV